MELWSVINKLIVMLYVIYLCVQSDPKDTQWLVLYGLVYVAMNLIILIWGTRYSQFRQIMLGVVILGLCWSAVSYHAIFALLIPFSVYELHSGRSKPQPIVFILVFIPLFFLPSDSVPLYLLVSLVSLLNYRMIKQITIQLLQLNEQADQQRSDRQRLTNLLLGNQEFMRTSEYTTKLEERNRLSQTIHDGIGHAMTGALYQMEAARRLLRTNPEKADELLNNAIGISKEGIEEIRLTLKNIQPAVEQLGFNRLKSAAESFGARAELRVTLLQEGELNKITPLHWRVIHANVTEALTNTAKYANATTVHIEVRVLKSWIKTVIADNGQGNTKIVKGLGLIGMEERTASVQGTLIADGSQGFSITMLIPY
ncbi:signal transduction histidine kinase [Paenibacillus shirakamiensis]|uniref:histidine kinase n=1 Tax=Paenibacillus shirakamiensis TaxID=1265935 RepID=A0ABS4JI88_9BACL|nr:histidine kinase [Paenibacillus shirakamiensis]MBP2001418.1 signal transduction histidine kinase [Paenibacillus shirakamiensis]